MTRGALFALGLGFGALAYPLGLLVGSLIAHHHNRPTHAFGA